MSISRPNDPYGLTAPPAWPEVDEDVLRTCAEVFHEASKSVQVQLEAAKQEWLQMFGGTGIWHGGASNAAGGSLNTRITDLGSVKKNLDAAAKLFTTSALVTTSAKNEITENVEMANKILDWIRTHEDIPEDAKTAAIDEGVAAVRAENIAIVAAAGDQVAGAPMSDSAHASAESPPPRADIVPVQDNGPSENTVSQPVSNGRGPQGTAEVNEGVPPAPTALDGSFGDENSRVPGGTGEATEGKPAAPSLAPAENLRHPQGTPETSGGPSIHSAPSGDPSFSPAPGMPVIPGASSSPGTSAPPRISAPASPLSGGSSAPSGASAPSAPAAPSAMNPAATAGNQAQMTEFQRAITETATRAVAQTPIQTPQPSAPMGAASAPQPSPSPSTSAAPAPSASHTASAPGPTSGSGPAPIAPPPTTGGAPAPPVQLGPPPTPPPAAPIASTAGPAVPLGTASPGSSTTGAPAPVPVSAARAQREAIAAATVRRPSSSDPAQLAQRVAAALNVGITDMGFYWLTGLAKDGTIVVANNYGLGYIPEGVNLPERVKMVTADESIPASARSTWATYPILALHGWAQHHNTDLQAVIATEEQFKGFDPGAPKIILRPDDIPENGRMEGRHRLQVISPDAATKLAAVTPTGLSEVLPPPPADDTPPEDRRALLWFEVFRPLLSNAPDRGQVQLQHFVTYADHAQELAIHRAHTAPEAADQRAAIADWIYWQHLSVLASDAIATRVTV